MPRAIARTLAIVAALSCGIVAGNAIANDGLAGDGANGALSRQRFADLPGVRPQDPLNSGSRIECEQKLIDRARGGIMPGHGPRYDTVNVCRRGSGPEFVSPMLPPSKIRQLRGFSY